MWTGFAWMPLKEPYQPGRPILILAQKSAALHVLFSYLVPGLGTMLAGRKRRGALIVVAAYGVAIVTAVLFFTTSIGPFSACVHALQNGARLCTSGHAAVISPGLPTLFDLGWVVTSGIWIFGMVDGYRTAKAWNRSHGFPNS
jgi:hypothetical protein